jgi:hypothetical protein
MDALKIPFSRGHESMETAQRGIILPMNILLPVVILLLLFAGGGFYFGSPVIGGSGLGLILLIGLIIWVMDGFHRKT